MEVYFGLKYSGAAAGARAHDEGGRANVVGMEGSGGRARRTALWLIEMAVGLMGTRMWHLELHGMVDRKSV